MNHTDQITCTVTLTDDAPEQSTPAPLPPPTGGDREQWLSQAAALIHGKPLAMPISYGFGRGGTRSSKGYSIHQDDSGSPQLFIHPTTRNAAELCARIAIATLDQLPTVYAAADYANQLPPFPTEGLPPTSNDNKDGIRQIKCVCPACGFTMRTSAKWIAKGLPRCACGTQIVSTIPTV
jgi:hypothetical protein